MGKRAYKNVLNGTDSAAVQNRGADESRVRILDLYLSRVSMVDILEQVEGFIREGGPHQVVTANMRFLSIALADPLFANVVNSAHLAIADGMPLVWLSKLLGKPLPQRITGCDLVHSLAKLAAEKGYSVYILGGERGTAETAGNHLRAMHPNLELVGSRHGYFTPDEEPEVVSNICACRPQLLFAGLGCPKQDFWIHRWSTDLQVPVCIGVGGTLDILAGRLRRAPGWIQRSGFEWAYRLQQEPKRLWRRYVLQDVPTTLRATGFVIRELVATRARLR